MARSFRGLRGLGRKPPEGAPPPTAPTAPANGRGEAAAAGSTPAPRAPAPSSPGVPPAGSAWPGAAPAVASSPPPASPASAGNAPAGRTGGPPGSPPPRRPAADGGSARASELKTIRRWQIVTAAWATAATVIAVLAFITAGDSNTPQPNTSAVAQAQRLQLLRLDRRVTALQARVTDFAQSRLIRGLASRIDRLDRAAARQGRQLTSPSKQQDTQAQSLTSLDARVAALEASAAAPKNNQGTTTTP